MRGDGNQNILRDRRQQRRVVAKSGDAETGVRSDFVQMRAAHQRVQMIRLPQLLNRQIGESQPLEADAVRAISPKTGASGERWRTCV